jgi:triosephosphate isomerase
MVAGNWKMHLTHLEAIGLVQQIAYGLRPAQTAAVETVVLPAFTALRSVQTCVDGDHLPFRYGAQDLAVQAAGAHTGDVSGPMLAALGCTYVTVGHSERRTDHGEDDAVVRAKVAAAFEHGLTPILCVGEHLDVREAGGQVAHCTAQLAAAVAGLDEAHAASLVVAYEPVWAIGTGRTATADDAQQMAAALRGAVADDFDPALARGVRILYGGSVKPDNAAELFAGPDVDGGLIGGASIDGPAFCAIVRSAVPA